MATFARVIGFLAILVILLPTLAAQDKAAQDKKDADKKDEVKKDDVKKDDAKKDDPKKDDAKKGDDTAKKDPGKNGDDKAKKKEPKKSEPDLVYGQIITAKLKRLDANSAREFGVDVPVPDPEKIYNLNVWKVQQMAAIAQDGNPVNRANRTVQLQIDFDRKQKTETFTMKEITLRAPPTCKFRSMFPPVEFDDKGKQKKWTQKELAALRGTTKLPGYPIQFDALRADQTVQIYLTKQSGTIGAAKGKKKLDDDDLILRRPEAVMIVVVQEAPIPK